MKMPTTWHLLIVTLTLHAKIAVSEHLHCGAPTTFTVEEYDNSHVYVYDAEVSVKYQRNNLAVYTYPNTDMVNILINETTVLFSGHVVKETEDYNPNSSKISRNLKTKIAGYAKLTRNLYSDDTLTDCQFYVARSRKEDNGDLAPRVQIEALHQAAVCIRSEICPKLGKITYNDHKNAEEHPYSFGPLAVIPPKRTNDDVVGVRGSEQRQDTDIKSLITSVEKFHTTNDGIESEIESTTNVLVDVVLAEIVKQFKEENGGFIKLPDITETLIEGSFWKPSVQISVIGGIFSDITTLKRVGDAGLSHKDVKFTVSCGFGLTKAEIEFEKYRLKSSLMGVSGSLSVRIDGIKIDTTVSVDLKEKPCRAILEKMHVTELGNLSVRISGLGPLNGLLSYIVSWISDKWKMDIVSKVENRVHHIVQQQFDAFDCEQFRP